MLHDMLSRLAKTYAFERVKPFAGSTFGDFVRHEIAVEAKKRLIFSEHDLKVKASVGAGNWAAVPWLAYFDPLITTSATKGFYVVYLINAQTEEIVLSLNQGTTAAYQSYGERAGREYLRRNAIELSAKAANFANLFDDDPIDLGSEESLPLGYMAGHAFGRTYSASSLTEEVFYRDLETMLSAYRQLVDLGGTTPAELMLELSGTDNITESRTFILSRRIERAPNVRPQVLKRRGARCEGCNLDPELHYGYRGPTKNTPLDVHHARPLHHLREGESSRYRIPDDFLVLCPTCHRMIHKLDDPSNLESLRERLSFRHK